MPIKPENRAKYGPNWKAIRAAILERARGFCECCRKRDRSIVLTLHGGTWLDLAEPGLGWRNLRGENLPTSYVRTLPLGNARNVLVILTVAHLDQEPTNHEPSNLAALCQACHLAHDRAENARKAAATRAARRTAA